MIDKVEQFEFWKLQLKTGLPWVRFNPVADVYSTIKNVKFLIIPILADSIRNDHFREQR
jgi:hypothetical protein